MMTPEQVIARCAADMVRNVGNKYANFYHVTTPENAQIIMREGFKDHAAQKGVPFLGIVTHIFDPGV